MKTQETVATGWHLVDQSERLPATFVNPDRQTLLEVWWTGQWLRRYAREVFHRLGTTESQFNVMVILADGDTPVRQQDLCDMLLVERASTTGLLSRMESQGLITRHTPDEDRRCRHVELTEKGLVLYRKHYEVYDRYANGIMDNFSDSECKQLDRLLIKMRASTRDTFARLHHSLPKRKGKAD